MLLIPPLAAVADVANGKEVYAVRCLKCHGEDGRGTPRVAQMLQTEIPDLTSRGVQTKKDQELLQIVNKGKRKMPAFEWSMEQKDREDVLAYVRALGKR